MTQKHTPGPWSVKPSETMRGDIEIHIGAYQKFYVPLHATDLTFEDTKIREANAALIAAAPTMYDFISAKAQAGDQEAIKTLEDINAR